MVSFYIHTIELLNTYVKLFFYILMIQQWHICLLYHLNMIRYYHISDTLFNFMLQRTSAYYAHCTRYILYTLLSNHNIDHFIIFKLFIWSNDPLGHRLCLIQLFELPDRTTLSKSVVQITSSSSDNHDSVVCRDRDEGIDTFQHYHEFSGLMQ